MLKLIVCPRRLRLCLNKLFHRHLQEMKNELTFLHKLYSTPALNFCVNCFHLTSPEVKMCTLILVHGEVQCILPSYFLLL